MMKTENIFDHTKRICQSVFNDELNCYPYAVEEHFPKFYRKWKGDKNFINFLYSMDERLTYQSRICQAVFRKELSCRPELVKKHYPNFYKNRMKRDNKNHLFVDFLYSEDDRLTLKSALEEERMLDHEWIFGKRL